ncbi:MAG: NADH-quinone oxidoreductase subunit NuoH [Bifidobacteriaceae bacterium]|jgi:NADH-quinone oxidoreductase subunit H|nr:NADH-quinone oxidoreductase subunit NuoH [Bifidobacteriaceae bacterium]
MMTQVLTVVGQPADFSQDNVWIVICKAVLILICCLVSVIVAIWFERKVIARLQQRVGPNVRGPFGLFQLIYDAVKLLLKEDMNVSRADKLVYVVAPMISVFASLMVFVVIPVGGQVRIPFTDIETPLQLTDFPVAVLYILAVTAIGVYGIVLGGWSSRSTYALLGSVRSSAQIISYELTMGMSLVTVFIVAGTMSTSGIVASQHKMWYVVMLAPSFFLYVISMVGETNRLPFDLPEAEGEIVAGYMTEYSSMKFAWFYLAEYINMLNVSAVASTLFLGGWIAPWPLSLINDGMLNTGYWTILWFLVKTWAFMFLFVWIRGSVVRFRYDQFMRLGWKGLLPAALIWIVLLTVVKYIDTFTNRHFNDWAIPLLGWVAVIFVIVWFWALKPEPKEEVEGTVEIDPFADGFPVPPLPGQTVPLSPRAQRLALVPAGVAVAEMADGAPFAGEFAAADGAGLAEAAGDVAADAPDKADGPAADAADKSEAAEPAPAEGKEAT